MSCINNTISEYLDIAGIVVSPPNSLLDISTGSLVFGNPDLDALAGIGRNSNFIKEFNKEVGRLVSRSNAAALKSNIQYYNTVTKQYQSYPPFNGGNTVSLADQFLDLCKTLAVLVFNKVVILDSEINVPKIDRFTGKFCRPEEDEVEKFLDNALTGLPNDALFTISKRINNIDKQGFTYTGVDVTAYAIFNNIVVPVKGLNTLSWSIHQDKNSDRRTYERRPSKHARGAQTVAGSLIFTLFNEDPVRSFTPVEFFSGNMPIAGPNGFSEIEEMLATEIPRFDLNVAFTNEYGAVSALTIWGVDITDAGGSISMRQLENEVVIQYKATSLDPMKPVQLDESRELLFTGVGDKGTEAFTRKRRAVLYADKAGINFEQQYKDTMDKVYANLIS